MLKERQKTPKPLRMKTITLPNVYLSSVCICNSKIRKKKKKKDSQYKELWKSINCKFNFNLRLSPTIRPKMCWLQVSISNKLEWRDSSCSVWTAIQCYSPLILFFLLFFLTQEECQISLVWLQILLSVWDKEKLRKCEVWRL